MNKLKMEIEMELIQQQANDNTFDILTGRVTMKELFKSNNDNTNYIEYESLEKYEENKNKNNYIACYEK